MIDERGEPLDFIQLLVFAARLAGYQTLHRLIYYDISGRGQPFPPSHSGVAR